MDNFRKLSYWPHAQSVDESERIDADIESFNDLAELFTNVSPVKVKKSQTIASRVYKKTRRAGIDQEISGNYLITLDYDSTTQVPNEVHQELKKLKINHFIFSTWSHKSFEKNNSGLNCFKVVLELTAASKSEALQMSKSLGLLVNKGGINAADDVSECIFFGGVHPDYLDQFERYKFTHGKKPEEVKSVLIKNIPPEKNDSPTIEEIDDFGIYIDTKGQRYTKERLQKALDVIRYAPIAEYSRRDVWLQIGMSLQSTLDDGLFDMWDNWSLENCSEEGHYDRIEMERVWSDSKAHILEKLKKNSKISTLGTLFHLEKLFLARKENAIIRTSDWQFFDTYSKEVPDEIPFLIDQLITEKSIGFLVGEGGVGKSSLCLEIAKAISSGRPLFDDPRYQTQKGTVAIINKEDCELKIHNQVYKICQFDKERLQNNLIQDFEEEKVKLSSTQKEEILNRWANVTRPTWAQESKKLTAKSEINEPKLASIIASLNNLKEQLEKTKRPPLKLLIIDPLNMWHGGDQNSQADMSLIFEAFQTIQLKLQIAVLIVHHMNKSRGFSGSHAIRDSGRFMLYLRKLELRKGEDSKLIELYVNKHNEAKSNYSVMQFCRTHDGLLRVATNTDIENERNREY